MKEPIKSKTQILQKLGFDGLNQMQTSMFDAVNNHQEVVLLSPTGTGKTLGFSLPLIEKLDPSLQEVQLLIVVPSRELALQIEQVIRDLGSGFKVNAVYGGRAGAKDRMELSTAPAILIGTPGRLLDHLERETIGLRNIKHLVLDEFDKSLEIGYADQMEAIHQLLPPNIQRIFTSATEKVRIPSYMDVKDAYRLNFLNEKTDNLAFKMVETTDSHKLEDIYALLAEHEGQGILFCNFNESIKSLTEYLSERGVSVGCFFGEMDQIEREEALVKFKNGTHRFLVATDLAARGIDVHKLEFIVHIEVPQREDEFIHRNGRTARMQESGVAYVLKTESSSMRSFIPKMDKMVLRGSAKPAPSEWSTLYVTGGRKDKISKGDLAGLFMKEGGLNKDSLGVIELKNQSAYVAVAAGKAEAVAQKLNNSRLKKKKVRVMVK